MSAAASSEVTRLTAELTRAERERDMYRARLAHHERWQATGPVRALAFPVMVAVASTAVFIAGVAISAATHADLVHQNPLGVTLVLGGAIGLGLSMFYVDDVVTHRTAARTGGPAAARNLDEVTDEIEKLSTELGTARSEQDRVKILPAAIPIVEMLAAGADRSHFADPDAAKLYGIIHGWRGPAGENLLAPLAAEHGWTDEEEQQLRDLHDAWVIARQLETDRRA